MCLLVYVLGSSSSFTLSPINDLVITQDSTDNPVTELNYLVERGFPVSSVSTSVLSTGVVIPALLHSQFH